RRQRRRRGLRLSTRKYTCRAPRKSPGSRKRTTPRWRSRSSAPWWRAIRRSARPRSRFCCPSSSGWIPSASSPAWRARRAERHASASTAVASLAAIAPEQAIYVADEFGIGRDDGYLEHMVQIWATENMDEASRWIDAQPAGPKTDQLRTRIEQVRQQTQAA